MTTRSSSRKLFTRPVARTIRKAPRRARLAMEELEDRVCLSTFTVTNTLDDGSTGSLRWAIGQADATGGADTINFDGTVFSTAQTIPLGGTQLELSDTTGATTITGPAAGVTVSGNNLSRVFQVEPGVTATISDLTITGGNAVQGGGVWNHGGTLALTDCTITGNSAGKGGGVLNSGSGYFIETYLAEKYPASVSLTNCTISGNHATAQAQAGYDSGGGGGLVNMRMDAYGGGSPKITATLTNCTITGNTATVEGGGLANIGYLYATGCTINANSAAYGGGVSSFTDAGLAKYGLNHAGNVRAVLTNCTVTANVAHSTARTAAGAGVRNYYTDVALIGCTLTQNTTFSPDAVWENNLESTCYGGNNPSMLGRSGTVVVNTIITVNGGPASAASGYAAWSGWYSSTAGASGAGLASAYEGQIESFNSYFPLTSQLQLMPLGNYGGPPETMPLVPDVPLPTAFVTTVAVVSPAKLALRPGGHDGGCDSDRYPFPESRDPNDRSARFCPRPRRARRRRLRGHRGASVRGPIVDLCGQYDEHCSRPGTRPPEPARGHPARQCQ